MGYRRRTKLNLRHLFGFLKDKASQSKALLLPNRSTRLLHVALLRATTHNPSNPPHQRHVDDLLALGINTPSTCIEALIDRLHNTHNSFVAFKCLIIVHCIIKRGSFLLQNQLSARFSVPGRNFLNLSNFHDNSTCETWNLSFWVRWYARALESFLLAGRNLGFYISCCSRKKNKEGVSQRLDKDLLRGLDVLVSFIEDICKAPELFNIQARTLVFEAIGFVEEDKCSAQNEIMIRVIELKDRVATLSFSDSVELVSVLNRFETCKERVLALFMNKENSVGYRLWVLIEELKGNIGESRVKDHLRTQVGESVLVSQLGLKTELFGGMTHSNMVPVGSVRHQFAGMA